MSLLKCVNSRDHAFWGRCNTFYKAEPSPPSPTSVRETLLVPKLKQRSGMEEINSFSIQASKWESHDPRVNAFMALHRAGGLFTNKVKSRICHQQHPECSLCGLPDGIEHGLYHCSSTQDLRNNADWEKLQSLPRQCLIRGLFPKEQLLEVFREALDELQPPPLEPKGRQLGASSLLSDVRQNRAYWLVDLSRADVRLHLEESSLLSRPLYNWQQMSKMLQFTRIAVQYVVVARDCCVTVGKSYGGARLKI